VVEGCDRLSWLAKEDRWAVRVSVEAAMRGVRPYRLAQVGTLVLLDADGREVTP